MPFKHPYFNKLQRKMSRVQPKRDWSDYNMKMKIRGDLTIWLSSDVVNQGLVADRHYDGTGALLLFSDMAIMTMHEI